MDKADKAIILNIFTNSSVVQILYQKICVKWPLISGVTDTAIHKIGDYRVERISRRILTLILPPEALNKHGFSICF
jgi:hypothetical protein